MKCIFVSDLHGEKKRFNTLFKVIEKKRPEGVFLGGDILPGGFGITCDVEAFLDEVFFSKIKKIKQKNFKIKFFMILGNDDPQSFESIFIEASERDLIEYVHNKTVPFGILSVTGYAFIPPTPFQLKDWEKYDVSQYVDIGGISPEEGIRSFDVSNDIIRHSTIAEDLKMISLGIDMERAIFLFHSPPYNSELDRAALDGKKIDHVSADVHVGSIAIQRFIKKMQPLVTLHGHVHESTRLTGQWHQVFGRTHALSAAHDGSELAVVRFDTDALDGATRVLA